MLEALFLLAEGGLLRLDLPLAGLDQRFSALDFLLRSGFSTRDCLRPFLEFLRFLCVRGLGFLERRLARFDVLQVREERGLLFLQRGLQRLVRLRFLGERSLGGGDLALATFELPSLGGVLLFERGASRPKVSLDDLGRIGPLRRSLLRRQGGLLSLLDRGLATFCRGLPFVELSIRGLDRPQPLLGGPFGTEQFHRLRLHPRAVAGQLLVHAVEPALQLLELLPAGCEVPLAPAHVDLTFARFALLLGDLAVLRREVLREFLHALRRLFELLPLVVEGRVLGLERFGLFGDFRAFLDEFRLAGLQVGRSSRERFLPFIERLFPLRHRADVVPQLQLPFPDRLLLTSEELLAAFGFPQAVVEDLPGLGNLLGLPLQIAVQIVHLFALAFEGRGPRVEGRLAVPVGGFLRRELALQPPEFGLSFREAAPLGLQIGAGLLGFHREDLLLGLDLHVAGRSTLFEAAQDQPARLLDRLQFGPEGVQFPLSHRAPLVLLFEFPFPAVQLLFALDEGLFLIATALQLLLVRLTLAGLLGDRLLDHLVRVSDALDRGFGV